MNEETFRKILKEELLEQDAKLTKTLDNRFEQQDITLTQTLDKRFKEQQQQMERYVGVVTEDYQSKLSASLEVLTPLLGLPAEIRAISEKLDDMKDDQHALKVTVVDHEQRIRVLEK